MDIAFAFGLSSFPSQTQVFEDRAPTFGFISRPLKVQVFVVNAPDFGLSSFPSQTQCFGNSILFNILLKVSRFKVTMVYGVSAYFLLSLHRHKIAHQDHSSL